jgi:hypothetical protein
MQRAQRAAKRLEAGYDFGILPVPTPLEVEERDGFDQVKQPYGVVASERFQLLIKVPPAGQELFAESFLLIVASIFEIDAIARA